MNTSEAYAELNLGEGASADDIKSAYRAAALRTHPDRPGGDAEKFKRINEANSILTGKGAHSGPSAAGGYDRSWYSDFWTDVRRAARESSYDSRTYRAQKAAEDFAKQQRERQERADKQRDSDEKTYGRRKSRGSRSYTPGFKCGKGNHNWVDRGGYFKCNICNATKTKNPSYKTGGRDYRSKVGGL
jgi:hypothetical protein